MRPVGAPFRCELAERARLVALADLARSGTRALAGRVPEPDGTKGRWTLRAERADDPFADVPWPPAIVTMRCAWSMLPWLSVGSPMPELDRRGASNVLKDRASVAVDRFGLLDLRVVGGDRSLSYVAVSFSNGAHRGTSASDALPLRTGADGMVKVRLPAGEHEARFFAPGYLAQSVELAVTAGKRGARTVELVPAEVVDVLAVTPAGVPVPFVRLSVIPKDGNTDERRSFSVFTDSLGRARLFVDAADKWFVYGDFGQVWERFPLDRDQAGEDGVVRVTKKQPVTLRIRGDRWPRTGAIHWCDAHGETHRGFDFREPATDAVVMRLCYRDDAETRVAGDAGVPFVILHSELPPAPAEPLLDLVEVDRTLRPRARLVPRPAAGLRLFRFAVRPTWQPEAQTRADSVMFNVRKDGGWMLYARDDAAFEAIATAAKHENTRIAVPRRVPDAGLPVLDFEFVAR